MQFGSNNFSQCLLAFWPATGWLRNRGCCCCCCCSHCCCCCFLRCFKLLLISVAVVVVAAAAAAAAVSSFPTACLSTTAWRWGWGWDRGWDWGCGWELRAPLLVCGNVAAISAAAAAFCYALFTALMRDLGLAYTHTHTIWDRADPAVSEKERESEREMCGELPLSGSSRIWFIKNSSKSAPASAQASCLLGRRFLQSIDAINQSGLRHSPSTLSGPRLWSLVSAHACCMICLQFNEVASVFSSRLPLTAFGRFLTQFLPYAKFSAGIPSQTQTEAEAVAHQSKMENIYHWLYCNFLSTASQLLLLLRDCRLETRDLRQLHWDAFKKRIKSKWKRKHY